MTPRREWLWSVLIPFLWIDLSLGMGVAVAAVIPAELTDSAIQAFVSVYVLAALIVGAAFGIGVWLVTLIVCVLFAKAFPRVHRVPAMSLALAIPGAIAVGLYRPWETPTVGLVSGTAAIAIAIVAAGVAAVVILTKAEKAGVPPLRTIEAQ